ncbi:hypothetical protein [Endozoicomonas atrinae]|uniref:hypothetical protein n=1 Tax=Endozoicomonas atrinae TaxID=1333660 RepID=UPI0008242F16|nr:hypothetical protein [Endozoicomonas atrinae]
MNVNHSIAGLLQGTASSYGVGDFVSRPAQESGAFDSQQAVKVQPHSFSFLTQNAAEGSTNVSIGHCTPERTLLSQRSSTFASPFSTYTQSSELCNQVKVGEPVAREGNAGSVCKNRKKRVLFSAYQTQELSKAF